MSGARLAARNDGKGAYRAARTIDDLERSDDQHRAGCRQLVQIGQAGKPVATDAQQQVMRGEWRIEGCGCAGIGSDTLTAETKRTLFNQILYRIDARPGRMRAVFVGVEERLGAGIAAVTIRPQHDP